MTEGTEVKTKGTQTLFYLPDLENKWTPKENKCEGRSQAMCENREKHHYTLSGRCGRHLHRKALSQPEPAEHGTVYTKPEKPGPEETDRNLSTNEGSS